MDGWNSFLLFKHLRFLRGLFKEKKDDAEDHAKNRERDADDRDGFVDHVTSL